MDTNLIKYIASFFYHKGYEDGKNEKVKYNRNQKLDASIKECLEQYNQEIQDEKRKDSPHHHLNRYDQ